MDYISEGKCVPIHIISLLGRSHLGGEKKTTQLKHIHHFGMVSLNILNFKYYPVIWKIPGLFSSPMSGGNRSPLAPNRSPNITA